MDKRTDEPPLCKCQCGTPVTWDNAQLGWHKYAKGHYRRDALYKHEDWLRAAYGAGKSIAEISEECGVSRSLISRQLKMFGIEQRTAGEQWRIRHEASAAPRCDLCGSPLGYRNTQGVCLRTTACSKEYQRRYKQGYLKDVEAGQRRAYPTSVRVPHVYAAHFPGLGILKVGSSTLLGVPRCSSRKWLRKRGFDSSDGGLIWVAPGHHLTEIYLQTSLSFRFPPRFQSQTRMSEWFDVQNADPDDLVAQLDELHAAMPPIPDWLVETETMQMPRFEAAVA